MAHPNAKLTDAEQYQVCQWFAEFKTPTQIKGLIKSEYGKDLTLKTVWQYSRGTAMKKWKPMIERLRQEWALGVMDIPLAHKRARLEKLVLLLSRAERNDQVSEYAKVKQCVEVLREMREEMEAGKAEFTNVYMTTIHNYSDSEILKLRESVLARLKQLGGKDGSARSQETITIKSPASLPGGDNRRGGMRVGSPEGEQVDSSVDLSNQHPSSATLVAARNVQRRDTPTAETGGEQPTSVGMVGLCTDSSTRLEGSPAVLDCQAATS